MIILCSFLSVEIFLALTGSFVLVTKYTLIVLPIVLLISVDGLLSIKSRGFRNTLITLIFLIYIFNLADYKNMPAFSVKANGYKRLTNELNTLNLNQNDYIIFPSGEKLIKKYLNNVDYIEFDIPAVFYLDKSKKETLKVFDKDFISAVDKHNASEKFISVFKNPYPTRTFSKFINDEIKRIPVKGRLIFVEDYKKDSLKPREMAYLMDFIQTDKELKKAYQEQILYLFYNKIFNDLHIILDNHESLKLEKMITISGLGKKNRNKMWKIFVYKKSTD